MMKDKDDSKVRQRICYQAFWKVFNSTSVVVGTRRVDGRVLFRLFRGWGGG